MDSKIDVENLGIRARGQAERIKFLKGETLSKGQAMLAHCYDCMGGYCDGTRDCQIETCSLYSYMPYSKNKVKVVRTEKQMEVSRKLSLYRSTGI